jgi:hypothetical protein
MSARRSLSHTPSLMNVEAGGGVAGVPGAASGEARDERESPKKFKDQISVDDTIAF